MHLLSVTHDKDAQSMRQTSSTEQTTGLVLNAAAEAERKLFLDCSHLLLRMVLETSAPS